MQKSIGRPKLIIVCGLPGAGKTTHAKMLKETLGAVRFCPDDWMLALSLDLHDEESRAKIEALQWVQAQRLLALGETVIIEWGTWGRSERDMLRLGARAFGADAELHHLFAPVEVLFERVQRRGMENLPLTLDDLERSAATFQAPTLEEVGLFDIYKAIKPTDDLDTPPAPHLDLCRRAVKRILDEHAAIPYAHGDLTCEAVFDHVSDRYLLVTVGWDRDKYIHFTLVHVDIANDKLWIRWDRTEDGIAAELVAAGIPKSDIVLGFKSELMRRDTEFAMS